MTTVQQSLLHFAGNPAICLICAITETGGFAPPPDGGFALYAAAIETGTNRARKVSVNNYKVSPNTYKKAAGVIWVVEKAYETRQKCL